MESNMILTREAWRQAGGFLGMELFGSRHMAAGEVLHLLHQLRSQGRLVAFVPQARAVHRMGAYSRRRFLARGYWQGVSAGMLDGLTYQRSWLAAVVQLVQDLSAAIILLLVACFSYVTFDEAQGMCYLVRAVRRFSLVLTQLHLVGDWAGAHAWLSHRQLAQFSSELSHEHGAKQGRQ